MSVTSLLGVAGGDLMSPTLALLVGIGVTLAGTCRSRFSLPTMLAGFARHSRNRSSAVLGRNRTFFLVMAVGSIVGVAIGVQLLGIVPSGVLLPLLTAILLISAVKVWHHH